MMSAVLQPEQRKGKLGSKQIMFNLSGAARPGRCSS
jgi:hypothetical protein